MKYVPYEVKVRDAVSTGASFLSTGARISQWAARVHAGRGRGARKGRLGSFVRYELCPLTR